MSDFEFTDPVEVKPRKGAGALGAVSKPTAKPAAQLDPTLVASQDEDEKVAAEKNENEETEGEKTPKYDPDELARIFDEIIFSGEYSEDVTVRGKLRVRFRTRTAEEIEQISAVVDATKANLVSTLAEKRAVLNLQYGLAMFQGKDLRSLSVEDRAKFVKRLPGPVIGALLTALNDFDAKVYAACQDGEENF